MPATTQHNTDDADHVVAAEAGHANLIPRSVVSNAVVAAADDLFSLVWTWCDGDSCGGRRKVSSIRRDNNGKQAEKQAGKRADKSGQNHVLKFMTQDWIFVMRQKTEA